MFRVLFYELFKADVVGTKFADPVENTALTGVKEGKVLGHLQQRPNTATTEHNVKLANVWGPDDMSYQAVLRLACKPVFLFQVKMAPGKPLSASNSSWIIVKVFRARKNKRRVAI